MTANFNSSEGDELTESHEINVTPFIDVMLVLLIIFMVAAPLATVDIRVDLPTASGATADRPDEPVYLTVASDLTVSVGEDQVTHADLADALVRATEGDPEARIFLRADRSVAYGDLMKLMNLVRIAGYGKIALVGLDGPPQPLPAETDSGSR